MQQKCLHSANNRLLRIASISCHATIEHQQGPRLYVGIQVRPTLLSCSWSTEIRFFTPSRTNEQVRFSGSHNNNNDDDDDSITSRQSLDVLVPIYQQIQELKGKWQLSDLHSLSCRRNPTRVLSPENKSQDDSSPRELFTTFSRSSPPTSRAVR